MCAISTIVRVRDPEGEHGIGRDRGGVIARLEVGRRAGRGGGVEVRAHRAELDDDRERLHSLLKSDLREYTVSTASPMPSFKGKLSDEEIADVIAYLLSLKGQ